MGKNRPNEARGLKWRQYYALIWKDFVVHKRHYIWTMLEITIPVLVCAMAILSNSHQGKPKLENERTFEPDDYERLYGDLNPARHRLLVAPNSSFTRALVDRIDDGAVTIELCNTEEELVELIQREIPVSLDQVKRLLPDENQNVTIGGVVIQSDEQYIKHLRQQQPRQNEIKLSNKITDQRRRDINDNDSDSYYYEVTSKLDGQKMKIPIKLDLAIRAKDFRLGPEPFPKKYSLGPFIHSDHYQATFFMASQIMISRAYINLLASYVNSTQANADIVIPTNDDLIGQRMPYPKYVAHKRLKETTLGTFVAGSQKQKPFVLTMDYCITVGFLVTAIFLAKRIVDEKKSRVRDMLRLVGISDWTYYGSHMTNTMLIMLIQCFLITTLFTGHHDAPAQNIDSTLMFVILLLYCLSAIMFVLVLSTMFNSSTKAIIFTSLLWLGLPEIIDRIFKMNSGVIESNGFWPLDEEYHLLFCLLTPNFALRLMNRLLTECDIYGEFYDKKQLYGEYRAIWPNLNTLLPLYKTITVSHIMGAMLLSVPLYACLIFLIDSLSRASKGAGGLASLSSEGVGTTGSSSFGCFSGLVNLIILLERLLFAILKAPFKLIHQILVSSAYGSTTSQASSLSSCNLTAVEQQQQQNYNAKAGHLNVAYTTSCDSLTQPQISTIDGNGKLKNSSQLVSNMELSRMNNVSNNDSKITREQILECQSIMNQHQEQMDGLGAESSKYFERAPGMLRKGVSIRNLCKTYFTSNAKLRRIDAVKNVSLDMFYSQILVLLGHNGAGKTTLIDIISGHNQKSSGSIHIDGYNIDTNPAEARRRVGFCPQFDVLFERLTVEEHLYFYGIVKGARNELNEEIEQLLKQSGLDRHRRKLSKALSGGYKRKLSLAIAMIAKSKVLILDEPTSGMDPESRRKVWDFLQLIRHDRLILMTTHHMEEADALGDRIAVMSLGQVRCCGSALFLKKLFNAGYHLRISKASNWDQAAFDEMIGNKYSLRSKLENITPHELMFKFDVDETSQVLPSLFDDLEKVKEQVGIFGFGITVSTMDDVFMKIGVHFKDVEAQEMQSKLEMTMNSEVQKATLNNTKKNPLSSLNDKGTLGAATNTQIALTNSAMVSVSKKERVEGNALFRQHVRAMLAKRYQHASRNWFQLMWILGISLFCVASIVILIDFVIFKEELTPAWSREMSLVGAGYGRQTSGIYQFTPPAPSASETAAEFDALRDAAFPGASKPTTEKPVTTTTAAATTTDSPTSRTSAPTTMIAPSLSSESSTEPLTTTTTGAPTTTTTVESANPKNSSSTVISENPRRRRRRIRATAAAIATIDSDSLKLNDSAQFLQNYWLEQAKSSGMKNLLTYTDANTEMIDLLTEQFADFRERYVIGGEKSGKKYIAWYNGEATHSFPISMNIMLNSILKQFTDLIQDDKHPLKGSQINLNHIAMAQINTLIAFLPHLGRLINLVFLPFSLAFITSYFVIFPTHERVTKSKHLQLMTGVPARTFWLSHFLFDIILYSIYTLAVLAIYFVWDRVINDRKIYFANFEHSVALIGLVTLFIFGQLPLAYIFSFMAKKPTSAFSSFCVLTILTGTATLTLVSLYELKYEHSASATFQLAFTVFLWTARLIPSVSLLVGLQKLFALNTTRSICINISPEVLELLCRYINSPLVDDELRVLKPERCCRQTCENECYDQWPFFWSGWFGVNVELAMLVFDALLYWSIMVLIESQPKRTRLMQMCQRICMYPISILSSLTNSATRAHKKYCWQVPQSSGLGSGNHFNASMSSSSSASSPVPASSQKDLESERQRIDHILSTRTTDHHSLIVDNLTKVYSTNQFKAVDQLSFCVDKREFFGLLGVNGAGKSTTFKMLTGELRPTSGDAWQGAWNVTQNRRQYLQQIGYCPQQDALIDSLTGAEMLALFARLRGIPEYYIESAVEDALDKLGLTRIGHIESNNYSGGNKRRLSVGMALIGAPEVIFLDEPTSGVDPRSRRRLWSTLIEFQQQTQSSIVMTSHSMNECECLCDRVAIMVGGQFKVLGSIQYLRTKLSQGFSLILKLNPDKLHSGEDLNRISDQCRNYMEQTFQSSQIQLRDHHQTIIQYHIQPSEQLTWSKMLVALEKAKQELDLEDYQITSDASLESIFLSLAKEQQQQQQQQQQVKY